MHKVMLTVLKANTSALSFYQSVGYTEPTSHRFFKMINFGFYRFTTDYTSPEYQSEDEDGWVDDKETESGTCDYVILSKVIADS